MDATVRRLRPEDADAYVAIRREMLADAPPAFLASSGDDLACDLEAVRRLLGEGDASAILGAFAPGLVGAVGVARERHAKAAHKAVVWGMYVAPDHRRRGLGRRLVEAAIAHARALPGVRRLLLSVSDDAPGARALYEAAGFRPWGTEPEAVHWAGRFLDEHHMGMRLDAAAKEGKVLATAAVVTLPETQVLLVRAAGGPAGAAAAFARLEAALGGARGRRFYGWCRRGEYRACAVRRDDDDAAALGVETGTLAGGAYARARHTGPPASIHETFAALERAFSADPDRASLEDYRRRNEVYALLPVLGTPPAAGLRGEASGP